MAFRGIDSAQFGVTMFPTDTAIGPVEVAKAVEERGIAQAFSACAACSALRIVST